MTARLDGAPASQPRGANDCAAHPPRYLEAGNTLRSRAHRGPAARGRAPTPPKNREPTSRESGWRAPVFNNTDGTVTGMKVAPGGIYPGLPFVRRPVRSTGHSSVPACIRARFSRVPAPLPVLRIIRRWRLDWGWRREGRCWCWCRWRRRLWQPGHQRSPVVRRWRLDWGWRREGWCWCRWCRRLWQPGHQRSPVVYRDEPSGVSIWDRAGRCRSQNGAERYSSPEQHFREHHFREHCVTPSGRNPFRLLHHVPRR